MEESLNNDNLPFKGQERKMNVMIHAGVWFVLYLLPFIFTGSWQPEVYIRSTIIFVSFKIVFYANYCWLINRYLYNRKVKAFLLGNVFLICLVLFLVHHLMILSYEISGKSEIHQVPQWNFLLGFFFVNFVLYTMAVGLSVAIRMTIGWFKVERIQQMFEKERAEAELKNLKSQLNPHFLFNTLNNIYSLIAFSPEKAQEAVHGLSGLLRYVLYESSQPQVRIEKDLNFIRDYVDLMHIRLPKQVDVKTNIQTGSTGILIAPLLFISLVENAFKHGVSNSKPSFIHIDIHQEANQIICLIRNSYYPKNPTQDKSGSGIGLVNLRKRLELIYPGQYTFECGKEGEIYRTYLSITFNSMKQ